MSLLCPPASPSPAPSPSLCLYLCLSLASLAVSGLETRPEKLAGRPPSCCPTVRHRGSRRARLPAVTGPGAAKKPQEKQQQKKKKKKKKKSLPCRVPVSASASASAVFCLPNCTCTSRKSPLPGLSCPVLSSLSPSACLADCWPWWWWWLLFYFQVRRQKSCYRPRLHQHLISAFDFGLNFALQQETLSPPPPPFAACYDQSPAPDSFSCVPATTAASSPGRSLRPSLRALHESFHSLARDWPSLPNPSTQAYKHTSIRLAIQALL
ncbi:hypothetical protein GTR04_7476 [Trichophyton interdigitale]|nr:hypothetical protein GY631_7477 [Trichophyton interdigitale]KAG5216561.1 hypothetical protein GY632_7431 [Trichophyton interdigitale]KAG8205143.1 hypothetical protein GTR04_7476 [Trichophyton interdigitale]